MLPSFTLTLPIPPGVNSMYLNRGKAGMKGRMISPDYMKWRNEAQGILWLHTPLPSFPGRVSVCIDCGETKGLADIDGKLKPILDLLTRFKIIQNDDRRYVRMVLATWNKDRTDCRVTISEME